MRTFNLNHQKPKPLMLRDFVILPFGGRLNADLAAGRVGDHICFSDCGEEFSITAIDRLSLRSRVADELCRMRYGVGMRQVYMRWTSTAIYYGYGKDAISKEECLIVFFVPSTEK